MELVVILNVLTEIYLTRMNPNTMDQVKSMVSNIVSMVSMVAKSITLSYQK